LIAALVARAEAAADAQCFCINPVQFTSKSTSKMFVQQPAVGGVNDGKTCSRNCTFTASLDKDDPAYSLQLDILINKLGDGTISISGMNGSLTTINKNIPTGTVMNQLSYGASITLVFTESASNLGEFMIAVQKVAGRAAPPVVTTTTTARPPPTTPSVPKFTQNPGLVANDVMLVFDLSSNDFEKYQKFARDVIRELSINPKPLVSTEPEDCGVGSRLSVVGLSALSGFDNLYAPYWATSYAQADGNIGSFVQISSGHFYFKPVEDKHIYGFDRKSPDIVYTNCKNRGKIFILFTSTSPIEYKQNLPDKVGLEVDFVDNGVHQIIAYYNMTSADKKYYELYDKTDNNSNAWNFFEITGGNNDVENFFNSFLVDSKEPMTCQPTSKELEVVITNDSPEPAIVSIPPYYNAKKGDGTGNWDTVKHYCNFQETTVHIVKDASLVNPARPDEKTKLCVNAFFDLETGKDFVSVFSGDPNEPSLQEEVATFTGRDISASFELPDALGSIVFSSDEKNVYDGFRAEITRAVNGYC
ncbi:hypothetical protein PENTCL1PPCAC_4742, partial [Pristionchus entomophagus]